jgi:hypothetical protein
MQNFTRTVLFTAATAVLAGLLPAQGMDPAKEIQEIARAVEEQLQEIDRLLLESSKKNQPRSAPRDRLDEAKEKSQAAADGIEKLIEKLNDMKNQGGGGSGSSSGQPQQGQDGQQPRPQQGQSGARRENNTPDFVPQGEPRPGEQPGGQQPGEGEAQPQPAKGNPSGGEQSPDGGENSVGRAPTESPTGPGNPGQGDGSWGELQPYLNFLRNRGTTPKVPEKFRKYWEAYLKQQRDGGK